MAISFLGPEPQNPVRPLRPGQVSTGTDPKRPYLQWPTTRIPGQPNMAGNGRPTPFPSNAPAPGSVLGSEAVRATQGGPFDAPFRQNLASYAGGTLARPGGNLQFDPLGSLFGAPTGGGNAPLQGMPQDLITGALGGQGFSFTPPTSQQPSKQQANPMTFWQGAGNWGGGPQQQRGRGGRLGY